MSVIKKVDDKEKDTITYEGQTIYTDIHIPRMVDGKKEHHISPVDIMGEKYAEQSMDPGNNSAEKEKLFQDKQMSDSSLHKCLVRLRREIFEKTKMDVGSSTLKINTN